MKTLSGRKRLDRKSRRNVTKRRTVDLQSQKVTRQNPEERKEICMADPMGSMMT